MENEAIFESSTSLFGFLSLGHDLDAKSFAEDEDDFAEFDAVFDSIF